MKAGVVVTEDGHTAASKAPSWLTHLPQIHRPTVVVVYTGGGGRRKKDHQHGPYASYYGGLYFAAPKYHNVFIEVWECPDHYLVTKAKI